MKNFSRFDAVRVFASLLNDFANPSTFGKIYLLAVITWVIIVLSEKLQTYSAPVESWFLKKREAIL